VQLAGHAAFTSYMAHAIFLTPSALAVRTPREVRSSACAPCGGSHAWRELLSGA